MSKAKRIDTEFLNGKPVSGLGVTTFAMLLQAFKKEAAGARHRINDVAGDRCWPAATAQ